MKNCVPNYTQIPNTILDYWMKELSPGEFRVIMSICRKTFGWHKNDDEISNRQLSEHCGLCIRSIPTITDSLFAKGLIRKTAQIRPNGARGNNVYELILHEIPTKEIPTNTLVSVGGSATIALGVVQPLHGGGSATIALTKERPLTKEKNKEIHNKKSPSAPASKDAEMLCTFFLESLKKERPAMKDPTTSAWKGWLRDMDVLLVRDKRSPEEIKEIIEWKNADGFWKTNCLCPASLLKHYDTFALKIGASIEKKLIALNREYVLGMQKKYEGELTFLSFDQDYVYNRNNGESIPFKLPYVTFREAFREICEGGN